jgi:hypothetical protein
MGKVATGLSMSLDGFIAGPNDGPHSPLGDAASDRDMTDADPRSG